MVIISLKGIARIFGSKEKQILADDFVKNNASTKYFVELDQLRPRPRRPGARVAIGGGASRSPLFAVAVGEVGRGVVGRMRAL